MRHVRIQACAITLLLRYRAAALPEVPRTAHGSLENRGGTFRIRIPDIRLREMRSCSHHDYLERPDGYQPARLALRELTLRNKAAAVGSLFCRAIARVDFATTPVSNMTRTWQNQRLLRCVALCFLR